MGVRFKRLLSDWLLVRLEPRRTKTKSGILYPDIARTEVLIGRVEQAGIGRNYLDRYLPLDIKVGERVAFFPGSSDTKSGKALSHYVQEDQRLIRENDILFALPEGLALEVTR